MSSWPLPVRALHFRPVIAARKAILSALAGAVVIALLAAGSATAEPPSIGDRRAQAQRVLGQIRAIDSQLAHAAEAYNAANIKLDGIRREQRLNERMLRVARSNLGRAQAQLEARLVALYTAGETGATLEVLLGATSLDDLLNRLETVERVSDQDAHVIADVTSFRGQVQRRKGELARARRAQAEVVAARAAHKAAVGRRLAARQRLLSSIRGEIARMQAAERRRQATLARQARARLAQQQGPSFTAAERAQQAPDDVAAGAAPAARYGGVVGIAMRFLGIPYKWGGASPQTGFDCSGFVMYVYAQIGVSLPHNAAAQYGHGTPVSRDELAPGDLVFFDGLGHNGIYIGGGQFIHSPHTGDVVKISSLSDGWYNSRFVGARRL